MGKLKTHSPMYPAQKIIERRDLIVDTYKT